MVNNYEFKVNDRVRIIVAFSAFSGKEGDITDIDDLETGIWVVLDESSLGDESVPFSKDELEKI